MAKQIKGITIELDGDTTGLQKALKDVNQESKNISGELKKVETALKLSPDNVVILKQKQDLLTDAVENTKKKLDTLKQAEGEVQDKFKSGEIGEDQYRDFQRQVSNTEAELKNYESRLEKVGDAARDVGDDHKDAGKKLDDFVDKAEKVGGKLKDIGGTMSAKVTAPILAGFAAVTKGTEDYRLALGKLETNAENSGVSLGTVEDAMTRLSGVNEDYAENVEAISNLVNAGFSDNNMLEALDALSGAVIRFPDTLKIEGLADGLQETLATGEAIGPFAELLERMGVPLETFNEGLALAAENGTQTDYILQTLADMGLTEVNDKFRENNEELVASREAQQELMDKFAELGEKLAPIATEITEMIGSAADKFLELDENTQNALITIGGIGAAVGPALFVIGTFTQSIASIIEAVKWLKGVMTVEALAAFAPWGVAIAGAIGLGILIITHWDEIKVAAAEDWAEIQSILGTAGSKIRTQWDSDVNDLKGIWESLETAGSNAWGGITGTIEKAKNTISGYISSIQGFFDGLDFSLPSIKIPSLPTFTISGEWDLSLTDGDGLSAPKVGVTWNADGAIFTKPTIFSTPNGMQGVGEAGAEAVLPIEKLPKLLGLDKKQPQIDYEQMAYSIVDAIVRSGLKIEMDKRQLGRLVGEMT